MRAFYVPKQCPGASVLGSFGDGSELLTEGVGNVSVGGELVVGGN